MFATPTLPVWLVDIIWFLGDLFVYGWLFFSLVMFIGGLVMLIIKPFVGVPQDGGGLTERQRKEEENQPKEKRKSDAKTECYKCAVNDSMPIYDALSGAKPQFTHIDDEKGEMLYPDEWQLTMWHKCLDWLFFPHHPNIVSQCLGIFLVTPLTNITALSLHYQLYLNEIFHTCFISRGIHYAMMPCITWTYFLFGAYWSLDDILHVHTGIPEMWRAFLGGAIGERYEELFALNGGFLVLCSFMLWYNIWGFTTKTYGFGFFMVPQLVMMWMAANVFNDWTSDKTGPWYNHSPLWANFIVLGAIFAFIQALSHTPEPLPPRVTRTAHWISIRNFVYTHSKNPLYIAWVFILQAIFGTIDEYWAGPRLLPLLMLKQMYMLGYMPEQWALVQQLADLALKSGDPALDYIGIGGAHQAEKPKVPNTYKECREEQRSLAERLEKEFTPIPAPGSKAYREYQTVNSRNNFLKGLRYRAKLNYRAYGPFVHDSNTRAKHQSRLANLRHDAGFTVFLDLVREDMFSLEATRQQDVFHHLANNSQVAKKKN